VVLDAQLVHRGEGLHEDGVVAPVRGVHQGQVVRGDGHGEFFRGLHEGATLPVRKADAEQALDLVDAPDAVAHVPLPVRPLGFAGVLFDGLGQAALGVRKCLHVVSFVAIVFRNVETYMR
jgi:hypothetical protein